MSKEYADPQKHTPTPWFASGQQIHAGSVIEDDNGTHTQVCEVYGPEANAAFIVKACNSYGRMYEAIEILLVEHARASVALGLPLPADTPGSIAARAALAKARGEEKIVPCSVCPTCNGYGYLQRQGKYRECCSSCDGTGRQN